MINTSHKGDNSVMSSVLQGLKVDSTAEQYRGLLEVSEAITAHSDLSELFQVLAARLRPIVDFDYLNVMLHDPERDVMRMRLFVTPDDDLPKPAAEFPVGESPSGWVWQTQRPLVVDDIETETRFPKVTAVMGAYGIRCFCVLPLTSAGRRLGALGFGSLRARAYTDADMRFMGRVAKQVAVAVDNALNLEASERARDDLGRESDRLRLLLDVNNSVVSNLELRDILRAITTKVSDVMRCDVVSFQLPDCERCDQLRLYFDFPESEPRGARLLPVKGTLSGRVFETGEPFVSDDLPADVASSPGADMIEGLKYGCLLPLVHRGRAIGVMSLARREGHPFTRGEVEFLKQVAGQVAIAVSNACAFGQIAELKEKLAQEKLYLEEEVRTEYNFTEIVGHSDALRQALKEVETVAPTDSVVLIQGETGTGKELIARAIHSLSARSERMLVKINCAAIPSGLLESELFGHERGAFTGAIQRRVGRFEVADKGTLFLDEVGDIPLELQPKLLRVLQEQEFERLGSSRTLKVNVRVIAATNRDLSAMVAEGTFRADLYYRLNVFPVRIPPLRERPEDIPLLVTYFTQYYARRMNKRIESVPVEAMEALQRHTWAGNVRELENIIERAVIITRGSRLQIPLAELKAGSAANGGGKVSPPGRLVTLEEMERAYIEEVLRHTGDQVGGSGGASEILGLPVSTLRSRMKKLGIRYVH
jgi:formate hydrogenlyase transcriptional activator